MHEFFSSIIRVAQCASIMISNDINGKNRNISDRNRSFAPKMFMHEPNGKRQKNRKITDGPEIILKPILYH